MEMAIGKMTSVVVSVPSALVPTLLTPLEWNADCRRDQPRGVELHGVL
jgi:hypothetical protein